MTEFKFRFKTEAELDLAKSTGYIDDYPIVRFKITTKEGHVYDFPANTEEEYLRLKEELQQQDHLEKIEVYPHFAFYDKNDYD